MSGIMMPMFSDAKRRLAVRPTAKFESLPGCHFYEDFRGNIYALQIGKGNNYFWSACSRSGEVLRGLNKTYFSLLEPTDDESIVYVYKELKALLKSRYEEGEAVIYKESKTSIRFFLDSEVIMKIKLKPGRNKNDCVMCFVNFFNLKVGIIQRCIG